jgi:hypothetical protein
MSRNVVIAVLLVVLVAAAAIGIGGYAYNLGVAQGMVESGKVVAPVPGTPPFAYGAPFGFYRPWGFGFGGLGCFFPFLAFLLFFFLIRGLFWHGRGWGGGRHWNRGAPAAFDEWHREAHGTPAPEPPAGQPQS